MDFVSTYTFYVTACYKLQKTRQKSRLPVNPRPEMFRKWKWANQLFAQEEQDDLRRSVHRRLPPTLGSVHLSINTRLWLFSIFARYDITIRHFHDITSTTELMIFNSARQNLEYEYYNIPGCDMVGKIYSQGPTYSSCRRRSRWRSLKNMCFSLGKG